MTYELNDYDRGVVRELEGGTPEGIRDAAQQMNRMQNNDEWKAIQSQFQQDRKANGALPDIQFGPDGSMVVYGAKGLPQGERFDGPLTATQNTSNSNKDGIEHAPAKPLTEGAPTILVIPPEASHKATVVPHG
jgi:hypothetical protein